jgi:hypothetical protein
LCNATTQVQNFFSRLDCGSEKAIAALWRLTWALSFASLWQLRKKWTRKYLMSTPSIVIASAGRTAVGSFNGAFANTPAHELGAAVIKGVLERAGVDAGEVDEVILGQVLSAGEGQNPARQAAIKAGLPQEATAWGMNQLCGSGLRAVALGMQQIATGDARIIVAGGMESMSLAPHCAHLRGGVKMGDFKMVDTMIGRPDRRLLRLSHGHHRREHRQEMATFARRAGPVRACLAEQGRSSPEGRSLRR